MAAYRILLAEDNEVTRSMMVDMLGIGGYEVILAENGREAVELAERERPDLILMDVRMPVMNGLEAVERIRSCPALSKVPIVALTASVGSEAEDRQLRAGCSAHLSKPIQTALLFETLARYLPGSADSGAGADKWESASAGAGGSG